jgi:hypothetical protein
MEPKKACPDVAGGDVTRSALEHLAALMAETPAVVPWPHETDEVWDEMVRLI